MLGHKSKPKLHKQDRTIICTRLACCLIVVLTPIILLKLLSISRLKEVEEERELARWRGNSSLRDGDFLREAETVDHKHVYFALTGADESEPPVGELFDVNKSPISGHAEQSTLRIRRNSIGAPPAETTASEADTARDSTGSELSPSSSSQSKEANEDELQQQKRDQQAAPPPERLLEGESDNSNQVMVMVASKSGKFNEILPLNDLIVAPTSALGSDGESNGASEEEPRGQQGVGAAEPSLANLEEADRLMRDMSAAYRSGQLSQAPNLSSTARDDLSADKDDPNDDDNEADDEEQRQASQSQSQSRESEPDSQLQPLWQPAQQVESPAREPGKAEVAPEQMPDSMESLMRSEQEEMGEPVDGGEPSASNQEESGSPTTAGDDYEEAGEESEGGGAGRATGSLLPASQTVNNFRSKLYPAPAALMGVDSQLAVPMGAPVGDLNTAAGHHYGKKKRKKVKKIVIKKKKKKKKKKVYKLMKVKVVKYKKKKKKKKIIIKKKKKKPKKKKKKEHHDHGKYYMYAKVPKKKSWEFGFKKGNKKHWIERHEKGHKNKFKTKVKWYDKKSKGKGIHIWDYNHFDKKKKKHH